MPYTFVENMDPAEYDAFVTRHPRCNLLQSSNWGKVKQGWEHRLTGVRDENRQWVAAALILIRRVRTGHAIWYIPRGPIADYRDKDVLSFYLSALKERARADRCVLIKIDPPVVAHNAPLASFEDAVDAEALEAKDMLESLGFRHLGFTRGLDDTIQPRYNAVTFDDGRPLEDRLTPKRRRDVLNAKKRLVRVDRGTEEDLDDFCYLIGKTEEAKHLILRDKSYFKRLMDLYGDDCMLYIAHIDLLSAIAQLENKIEDVTAKMAALPDNAPKKRHVYQEQLDSHNASLRLYREMREKEGDRALLAGCFALCYGRSCELLYAGFNRNYTRLAAQDVAYVATMNHAFQKGAAYVSMGGISGDLKDGLLEYKSHFDPHIVSYLGEFDFPVRPMLYRLYRFAKEKLGRRFFRRLG